MVDTAEAPLKIKFVSLLFVMRGSVGAVFSITEQAGNSALQQLGFPVMISLAAITAVFIYLGQAVNRLKPWSWDAVIIFTSVFLLTDLAFLFLSIPKALMALVLDIFVLLYLYKNRRLFTENKRSKF